MAETVPHPIKNLFLLQTEKPGVALRKLTFTHAPYYFDAVDASRDLLSRHGSATAGMYPYQESVERSITHPLNPDKLRMGIWDKDTFVGSVNATPMEDGSVELGYWLDERQTGYGYATFAVRALASYAAEHYSCVYAQVVEGNDASVAVLERSGFQQTGIDENWVIFTYMKSGTVAIPVQ
jgi:RimJ/RimL family protein N-acetyltransferase